MFKTNIQTYFSFYICSTMNEIKTELYRLCEEILRERIRVAENAMREAQESANHEEKSSAGDKYETSRAMGQIERDMNAKQMQEARNELERLSRIDWSISGGVVATGSLVCTDAGYYFIAVGIGMVKAGNKNVIVLSAHSPMAKILLGKKKGDRVSFNGKIFMITEVM